MLWDILLSVGLVAAITTQVARVAASRRVNGRDSGSRQAWSVASDRAFMWTGVAVVLVLPSLIAMGVTYHLAATYHHSGRLVEQKIDQRDALAEIVADTLSADEFAALMAATPETDLLLILGNQASAVLVERARTLVALNAAVNDMLNDLERTRISLCAYHDNPITPRLFVTPGCPDPIVVEQP